MQNTASSTKPSQKNLMPKRSVGPTSRYVWCSDQRLTFQGDTQSGVSFRSIIYIPSSLPDDFWSKATSGFNNVRLMVKVRDFDLKYDVLIKLPSECSSRTTLEKNTCLDG